MLKGICLNATTGSAEGFIPEMNCDILPSGYFLIRRSNVPISALVEIGVYGRTVISPSISTPARIQAQVLKPSDLVPSGSENLATYAVSEIGVFSTRATFTKSSPNWQFPGGTVDLVGAAVRPAGRTV